MCAVFAWQVGFLDFIIFIAALPNEGSDVFLLFVWRFLVDEHLKGWAFIGLAVNDENTAFGHAFDLNIALDLDY